MAVKHKKTAGAARQSDPTIIDGPDWDDDHRYTLGSVFTLGFVDVAYYTNGTINVTGTRVTGSSLNAGAGKINITLDMSGLPISDDDYFSVVSMGQQSSLNSNLQWTFDAGQNGACSLHFIQNGSAAMPSANFIARFMLSIEVML